MTFFVNDWMGGGGGERGTLIDEGRGWGGDGERRGGRRREG